MELFSSDNLGHRVPAGVRAWIPVHGNTQLLTAPALGADATITVTPGKSYVVVNSNLVNQYALWIGISNVTVDLSGNANGGIMWMCPPGRAIIVTVPIGVSVLHYAKAAGPADETGYLIELAE